MERVTSAEDVKWCIDSGTAQQDIRRNGSELGLHEIFKELSSFPSVSSYLAQLGETTSTTVASEEKTAPPPFHTLEERPSIQSVPTTDTGTLPTGQLPCHLPPDALSRGITRVPSLEVLKMFLGPTNPLYAPSLSARRPEAQGVSEGFGNASSLNNANSINSVNSSTVQIPMSLASALPQGGVIPPAPHSAILTMNPAAAAAALQFSQFTSAGLIPQTVDMELIEKSEQRRARRMLSNRESARRSRKRKQEHLHTLEEEIGRLQEEKTQWLEAREKLTRRCTSAEEECMRLKEENVRLRDELSILGLVKSELLQSRKQIAAAAAKNEEAEK